MKISGSSNNISSVKSLKSNVQKISWIIFLSPHLSSFTRFCLFSSIDFGHDCVLTLSDFCPFSSSLQSAASQKVHHHLLFFSKKKYCFLLLTFILVTTVSHFCPLFLMLTVSDSATPPKNAVSTIFFFFVYIFHFLLFTIMIMYRLRMCQFFSPFFSVSNSAAPKKCTVIAV